MIVGNKKHEVVWDKERGHNFERGTCLGHVANLAVNSAAAELDCTGLQYAATWSNPMFVHKLSQPMSVRSVEK